MSTPKPLFTLNKDRDKNKDGDLFLLRKLKSKKLFPYLSSESREIINDLKLGGEKDDFRFLHDKLINLWPLVLANALLELKRHDEREWNPNEPEVMESFFDPASLGVTELEEVLKAFSEFEGMMYGASPSHYRDHVAHSFRVWIIGQLILGDRLKHKLSSLDKLGGEDDSPTPSTVTEEISKTEWNCMWAIVALCHDIGYPLSAIEKINRRARDTLQNQGLIPEGDLRFTFRQQMLPFHETVIRLMASKPKILPESERYLTHLQNKYYLKLLKSFDKLDHGIVSSLLISKALVYFLEADLSHDDWKTLTREDARQFLIRREILRAIAAHTCQDIYHLRFNTLSFLLYLVDEMQCWGRPTLEELQHEATNIQEGYSEVYRFSTDEIDIRITTKDKQWDESQQKVVLNQVLKLRKMLRLAPYLKESLGRKLRFEVRNEGGHILRLELGDRGIKLGTKKFEKKVLKQILMLEKQAKRISS